MGNAFFGEQKTLKEVIREQKHMVNRSIRELEREKASLKRDEAKLIIEIKKAAKANSVKSMQIMAKDLVRMRKHQEKYTQLIANLRAVSLQMTAMASTVTMTDSLKKVTRAMTVMNRTMNMPQLQAVMREFQKQSEILGMKEELFGEAIEGAMDDEQDEEATEQVVNQVLDEIGITFGQSLGEVPTTKVAEKPVTGVNAADKALEDRFNAL